MTTNERWAARLEAASLTAWPAEQTYEYQGWLLRCSSGYTNRANCIIPSTDDGGELEKRIDYCEKVFRVHGLRPVFQLPSFRNYQPLDEILTRRGYTERGGAEVLMCSLPVTDLVTVEILPPKEWFEHHRRLATVSNPTGHLKILEAIPHPCLYAVLYRQGQVVACGLGVWQDELVGLFDIVTDPTVRRRGYGRHLVSGILAWGAARGATHGYLQVALGNDPAVALYSHLGFVHVYNYRYNVSQPN